MKNHLPWIIFLTLFFPIVQLLIYFLRFGAPGADLLLESLTFLPIGLLGSLILFYFYDRAESDIQRNTIVVGFVLALPFALLGSLTGGLLGLVGVIAFGIIPLAVGVLLGSWAGGTLAQHNS